MKNILLNLICFKVKCIFQFQKQYLWKNGEKNGKWKEKGTIHILSAQRHTALI